MKSRLAIHPFPLLCLAVLLTLAIPAPSPADSNRNPTVLPPQSKPYGKTYGEWGGEWWRWAMAIPSASNPIFDADGSFCNVGQSGPVWFLAGTGGGSVNRSCSIPPGKAVFFPIIDILADYPCPPEFGFEPAPGQSLEDFLTGFARFLIDLVDDPAVEVDGVALENVTAYRGASGVITFTGDPSLTSTFDPCITGSQQVGASDGYFVMLAPLSRGTHTVHFSARIDEFGFGLDVTYVLQVGPHTGGPIAISSATPTAGRASTPGTVNLKTLAQSFGARGAAATRKNTWGDLKVLYR